MSADVRRGFSTSVTSPVSEVAGVCVFPRVLSSQESRVACSNPPKPFAIANPKASVGTREKIVMYVRAAAL